MVNLFYVWLIAIGLIFVDGDFWQEQRRFTLRHLRDLGFGKTSIEDQMIDEINDLISDMTETAKSDPGHVVDFKSIFTVSAINILWAIIGGKRFQRDNVKFKKLLNLSGFFFIHEKRFRFLVVFFSFVSHVKNY